MSKKLNIRIFKNDNAWMCQFSGAYPIATGLDSELDPKQALEQIRKLYPDAAVYPSRPLVNEKLFRRLAEEQGADITFKKQAFSFMKVLLAQGFAVPRQDLKKWYGDYSEATWNLPEPNGGRWIRIKE